MQVDEQEYKEMQITIAAQTRIIESQKKQIVNLEEQVKLKDAMLKIIESANVKGIKVAAIF